MISIAGHFTLIDPKRSDFNLSIFASTVANMATFLYMLSGWFDGNLEPLSVDENQRSDCNWSMIKKWLEMVTQNATEYLKNERTISKQLVSASPPGGRSKNEKSINTS